jgi:phage terminase small subunit
MSNSLTIAEKYGVFAEAHIATGDGVKAAKEAGYKGNAKTLAVTASRLLKNPKVKAILKAIRKEIKTPAQIVCEKIRVDTEMKREFLWDLAKECAKVVRAEEEIGEYVDSDGQTVKTLKVVESVYKPREAIDAIAKLNEMDGDIAPAPTGAPGFGSGFTIEQAIMNITTES